MTGAQNETVYLTTDEHELKKIETDIFWFYPVSACLHLRSPVVK